MRSDLAERTDSKQGHLSMTYHLEQLNVKLITLLIRSHTRIYCTDVSYGHNLKEQYQMQFGIPGR